MRLDDARLDRFHFYDAGQGWMRLLDRLAEPGWQDRVERRAPDLVLAEEIDASSAEPGSNMLEGDHVEASEQEVRRFMAAVEAHRDSVVDAFWGQPGIPVYMRLDRGPNRATGDPDAIQAIVYESGEEVYYVVNLNEARHWYPGEPKMSTRVRRGVRTGDCPDFAFCLSVVTPVAGETATVDGRSMPLDQPGEASGKIIVELPALTFHSDRADLRVFTDSIVITVGSAAGRAAD